jgi:DNA-binding XRE family transcriptional regulator
MRQHKAHVTDSAMQQCAASFAISFYLLQLRKAAKLSQEELAEQMGCHRNTVYRMEHGDVMALHLFFPFCRAVGQPAGTVIEEMARRIDEASRLGGGKKAGGK